MTALSDNYKRDTRPGVGPIKPYVVKSGSTVWMGSFVGVDANGYLVPWTVVTGTVLLFVGISTEKIVGDGTLIARVNCSGLELRSVAVTGASTIANVGDKVYLTDDGTGLSNSAPAAGGVVGHITKFISSTAFDVRLYTAAEYAAADGV